MKIRKASLSDLNEIRQLFYNTVQAVNRKDYDPDQIEAWSSGYFLTNRWQQKLQQQHFFVAVIDDEIVGFSSLSNIGLLDFLYVHKNYQSRGIATQLLNTVKQYASELGITKITADVSKTAKSFFEKYGFVLVAKQTVFIENVQLVNYKMILTIN